MSCAKHRNYAIVGQCVHCLEAEIRELRADLARVTSERDERVAVATKDSLVLGSICDTCATLRQQLDEQEDEANGNIGELETERDMAYDDLARVTNERDALAKRVMDYDTLLTAEMPLDFKDWHQNSKSEWPEVAAWCLRHRQEQLQHVTDERDALHEAAHKHHADMDVVIAERDAARENEINALGLMDTRTNQLAEARDYLARMASSAIEQQESRHELDKGLANMICALESDLARVTAERDDWAWRWAKLYEWSVDEGWDFTRKTMSVLETEHKDEDQR